MPRKARKPQPPILSDNESESEIEPQSVSSPPAPSVDDLEDIPPAPKQQPGRLSRVYTLEDDDNENLSDVKPIRRRAAPEPIVPLKNNEQPKANIADLVAILTSSNASMKGKIDDTGRFELEFELNREQPRARNARRSNDRTSSPEIEERDSPKRTVRAKPGNRKSIGWIR
jgi:hypothetical protein